jgi:alpha-D-xyloside xylohydrolase
MKPQGATHRLLSRRHLLISGAALTLYANTQVEAAVGKTDADLIVSLADGDLAAFALSPNAIRVRFAAKGFLFKSTVPAMLQSQATRPKLKITRAGNVTRVQLAGIACEIDAAGVIRFYDSAGTLILQETAGERRLSAAQVAGEPTFSVAQSFDSPDDERLYGTGCFQDGALDIRRLPRRLTQVNTQISLPFVLSNKGYGLLWCNFGMSELNAPSRQVSLHKVESNSRSETVDVTTGSGNAKATRQAAVFEGHFATSEPGPVAFLLDVGQPMASRHYVEIDGKPYADFSNLWLPPTTGFVVDLPAGDHKVRVEATAKDAPVLYFDPAADRTTWRSPVADGIDYVVIAGPDADTIMAGYRDLVGSTPIFPLWAYGYIHCRERFTSQAEILDTAREFRRRKLPVDVMVQDWQYWGKHGWNAMRFDEQFYPEPAKMMQNLHALDMRMMLSVWSKISRDTELGKAFAEKGYYIPGTDWIDFFNPKAADFYSENQNQRLTSLGIDAWWQDATEPENDDLVGRRTAAGPGERMRLAYPLQVSRTVYESQRRFVPDRRVMILTRSAFIGQQRYAAATWSGDIGNNWETLRRQIPAGLNMAAAGYPYWTVDAGGFFRPGSGQYTDTAYHERFLRWFQYATFLPLQRVHGYQTNTEFWNYGEQVETVARAYLDLRYRLLPYIYSLAGETWRTGTPIMRPLVFDFRKDGQALDEAHAYMFGRAFHVAPVLAQDATTWPVYLPDSAGGWYDFWTGERRNGGERHDVPAPLDRLPLHVRAGTILPLGPVLQSTAEATGQDLDVTVFPGRNGAFTLYEDNGRNYDYENGRYSLIEMSWDDRVGELTLAARKGGFEGMPASRRFNIRVARDGVPPFSGSVVKTLVYDGRSLRYRPSL